MACFSTATAPERRNPTGKNRVWDFFRLSNGTHPETRRQPAQPRRKIRPTPTKTASGIPYWPSRDPIEEEGGVNLYGFVRNDGVDRWDLLGQYSAAEVTTKMREKYGAKVEFALHQFEAYGHTFSVEDLWFRNFDGGYRFAKVDCGASSTDQAADWGMDALREWAEAGSGVGVDEYFVSISRKWARWGDSANDTGAVLGSVLDWLHLFSGETSRSTKGGMYYRDRVPSLYLRVFTNSRSIADVAWDGRAVAAVPITGVPGPAGLHSDYWDGVDNRSDQTHHFAVYFAFQFMTYWGTDFVNDHFAGDAGNVGDRRLSRRATKWQLRYMSQPDYYGKQIEADLKSSYSE